MQHIDTIMLNTRAAKILRMLIQREAECLSPGIELQIRNNTADTHRCFN